MMLHGCELQSILLNMCQKAPKKTVLVPLKTILKTVLFS